MTLSPIEAAEAAVADEDLFVFPDAWRRHLHPRRGGAPGSAVKPDRQAGRKTDELVAAARTDWLDAALQNSANNASLVEAIGQALDGVPTPLGAAALARAALPAYDANLAPFADTWAQRHGMAFAAEAAMLAGDLRIWPPDRQQLSRVEREGHQTPALLSLLRRTRALLASAATCPEEDYAKAVEALSSARACCENCRIIAAYLVPTETEWVLEACRAYPHVHAGGGGQQTTLLQLAVSTNEQVSALGDVACVAGYRPETAVLVTMVDGLGEAAIALFEPCFGQYVIVETIRLASSLVALVPGDLSFRFLLSHLDLAQIPPALQEASDHQPRRAVRLLAEAAQGAEPQAAKARELLERHVRAYPEIAASVAEELPEADKALVLELLEPLESGDRKPAASVEALPSLLVSPPWLSAPQDTVKAKPTVVKGLQPAEIARVDFTPEELEADWWDAIVPTRMMYPPEYVEFRSGPVEEHRQALREWRPYYSYFLTEPQLLWPLLRNYGFDALPIALAAAVEAGFPDNAQMLLPVLDVETARLMAGWLLKAKSSEAAEEWLDRHGADAARLLIPDAVGKAGPARRGAEAALRYLAAALSDLAAIADAEYGAEAAKAVRAILAAEPKAKQPTKAPDLPAWLAPNSLPQVLLADGESALPDASVTHLLELLALSPSPAEPYPGLVQALEGLDRASLAAFGWAVFTAWRGLEYPKSEAWALGALGLLGDDTTVAQLVPIIKAWPGESGHHRAVAGLDVLEAIGTDFALQRLNEIAQRVTFKALKERSREKISAIAARLGLTGEQLADRLVPDLGLDAEGGLWLDYGPRRFRVGFDEQLKPFIADEAGARRKDLPAPNSKDDAELAASARQQYAALKKEARAVAADEIRRLEAALVDQRSWTTAEFTDLLAGHPLLRHVVRRLVWVAEVDGVREGFRAAEDGTLADAADEAYALPAAAVIRLAHPLTWPEGLAKWGEIFADYEILQPFDQLGREVQALTEQERAGSRLARFEGVTLPVGKVLGLTKGAWERSAPMDNGTQFCLLRQVPGGRYLIIDLDPGIQVGMIGESEDQTLQAVYLSPEARVYHRGFRDEDALLGELDPLTASELLRELNRLVD